jgi:leucyl aminopeptidase
MLATEAMSVAKRYKIKARVLDVAAMKRIGMGAVLGVAAGSIEKPKFIILEYLKGPKNQKPLVLAGKGVTFDSGGVNLKPDQHIYEMHMDMSGGAAVIHGMAAIARLKLHINVVGLIPAVENMPSGSSYRPGDQLKSMSGKTIEVLNTDAEGRIILADALTYGLRYKPEIMIDLATLTGAAHVALGNYCSAIFSNDEKLQNDIIDIGKTSGDYLWPLPLWDEFLSEIKGTFGDLANTGIKDRYGGASHGAKFLEQFAGNTRFVHLDIAPRMTANDSEFLSKGASGVGVRLIAELGKHYLRISS